jgi:hypothetical protein
MVISSIWRLKNTSCHIDLANWVTLQAINHQSPVLPYTATLQKPGCFQGHQVFHGMVPTPTYKFTNKKCKEDAILSKFDYPNSQNSGNIQIRGIYVRFVFYYPVRSMKTLEVRTKWNWSSYRLRNTIHNELSAFLILPFPAQDAGQQGWKAGSSGCLGGDLATRRSRWRNRSGCPRAGCGLAWPSPEFI